MEHIVQRIKEHPLLVGASAVAVLMFARKLYQFAQKQHSVLLVRNGEKQVVDPALFPQVPVCVIVKSVMMKALVNGVDVSFTSAHHHGEHSNFSFLNPPTPQYFTNAKGLWLFMRKWEVPNPKGVLFICHGYGEHIGRYEHVAQHLNAHGFAVYGMDHQVGHSTHARAATLAGSRAFSHCHGCGKARFLPFVVHARSLTLFDANNGCHVAPVHTCTCRGTVRARATWRMWRTLTSSTRITSRSSSTSLPRRPRADTRSHTSRASSSDTLWVRLLVVFVVPALFSPPLLRLFLLDCVLLNPRAVS